MVSMGKPHYSRQGKITKLLTLGDFITKAEAIQDKKKRAFAFLLFYTGVRVGELTRALKEQFYIENDLLLFNVGPREKTKRLTPPLQIPVKAPGIEEVWHVIKYTRKGQRVFDFDRSTAWRLIAKYFDAYPHYFRLNRITQFLIADFSPVVVIAWSGHKKISGLDAYVGQASVKKLGASLGQA